jgi:rubrerythrin
MKKQVAQVQGQNRTGIATHDSMAEDMMAAVAEFPPKSSGSSAGAGKVRVEYAQSVDPDELGYGSVPMPIALGRESALLFDKLGERLAFERTGTRLYEAVISKHEAFGSFPGGPNRAQLLEILNEEHRHFRMLEQVVEGLGGDPTAVTPAAVVAGTIGGGVVQVVTEARTTLLQSLEAVLVAELADRAGWNTLIELARKAKMAKLVTQFEVAERREQEHVAKLQRWIAAGQGR